MFVVEGAIVPDIPISSSYDGLTQVLPTGTCAESATVERVTGSVADFPEGDTPIDVVSGQQPRIGLCRIL